jgi:hypothetical protein
MSESQARRRGVRPVIVCAIAGIALLAAVALVRAARTAPHRPASSAEVAASLAQGVAWIWPNSNGPQPPYREAAVLVESLTLRTGGVERGGRTQPMALPATAAARDARVGPFEAAAPVVEVTETRPRTVPPYEQVKGRLLEAMQRRAAQGQK